MSHDLSMALFWSADTFVKNFFVGDVFHPKNFMDATSNAYDRAREVLKRFESADD